MKDFVNAQEVADVLRVSKPKAYEIIRALNGELESKGYFTNRGLVSSKYLLERYGLTNGQEEKQSQA